MKLSIFSIVVAVLSAFGSAWARQLTSAVGNTPTLMGVLIPNSQNAHNVLFSGPPAFRGELLSEWHDDWTYNRLNTIDGGYGQNGIGYQCPLISDGYLEARIPHATDPQRFIVCEYASSVSTGEVSSITTAHFKCPYGRIYDHLAASEFKLRSDYDHLSWEELADLTTEATDLKQFCKVPFLVTKPWKPKSCRSNYHNDDQTGCRGGDDKYEYDRPEDRTAEANCVYPDGSFSMSVADLSLWGVTGADNYQCDATAFDSVWRHGGRSV